jgi:protoporphyrinogen oxidase
MKKVSFAFVGGGLPSLLLASLLSKFRPTSPILIIESSNRLGGQFKSIQYPNGELFDQGMHIYYETEISEIDEAFLSILPENEWNYLIGNRKDVAGIFFNGKLQITTPYPDLRDYPHEEKMSYIQSMFETIEESAKENPTNMSDHLNQHFGPRISQEIFVPILQKLYGLKAVELDPLAFRLTAINRVVLFNEQATEDLMKSEFLRARIGYPDQLNLPNVRKSKGRGLYPKSFGFGNVIDKLIKNLHESGVLFISNTRVKEIIFEDSKIKTVKCNDEIESHFEIQNGVIWSADVFSLLKLAGKPAESKIQFGLKKCVNLLLKNEPKMGDLYYFYNFEELSNIFRVTNYSAYCSDAAKNGTFPICVEYWAKDDLTDHEIKTAVILDLVKMQIIPSADEIVFGEISPQPVLFPNPSVEAIDSIRNAIKNLQRMNVKNLILIGPLTSSETFFLHEVLRSGYKLIKEKGWL